MTNLPNVTNPTFPEIYQLAVDDPVAGGEDGVDNLPHKQLAERTLFLKALLDDPETGLDALASRLTTIEATSTGAVVRAVPLAWQYGSDFDFELFAAGFSWRDVDPIAVTQTVSGDDSVDVANTTGLQTGATYVIYTGSGTTETVVIEDILSSTRFTAAADLGVSLSEAHIARTSWTVGAGFATAPNGGLFYSRPVQVFGFTNIGNVIIRRDNGDGILGLFYRAVGDVSWTAATLVRTAAKAAGTRDEEYTVAGGEPVEFKITSTHGPSATDIKVYHLVAFPAEIDGRNLSTAPTLSLVAQPINGTPAGAATSVITTPTLVGSPYRSLYGVTQDDAQFQIATDQAMAHVIYDELVGSADTEIEVDPALSTNTIYWWRCRYKDDDGVWSPWSTPTSFTTGATLQYIKQPLNTAPGDGTPNASLIPVLQSSAFVAVGGVDTHAASQWQVATNADFSTIVRDSNESTTAKLSWNLGGATLTAQVTYYWRVRHKGTAFGWSPWSVGTRFTAQAIPSAPTNTLPTNASTGVSLTPELKGSPFFVPATNDVHQSSQWQVASDAGFTTIVHNSGETTAHKTTYTVPGGANLAAMTTYYWRVRYRGQATGWGDYSAATTFQTGLALSSQKFTASGTFTVPANVTSIRALVIGGGGSGGTGGSGVGNSGGGGGGGGQVNYATLTVTPGQQIAVTVGAGGSGATTQLHAGNAGGTSSLGTLLSAAGGGGGGAGTTSYGSPGAGGSGSTSGATGGAGGAYNLPGGSGTAPTIPPAGTFRHQVPTAGSGGQGGAKQVNGYHGIGYGRGAGGSQSGTGNTGGGGGGGGGVVLGADNGGFTTAQWTGAWDRSAAGAAGVVYIEWGA